MKKRFYLSMGIIWLMASAVSFALYVQGKNPADLVRCGMFMFVGILYLHLDKKYRK